MPKIALAVILVIGLTVFYLGSVATLCIVLDRALARRVAVLRFLASWLIPLLGAIVTIRVAVEESQQNLRSRWWLWPLRPLLSEAAPDSSFAEVTDMRADAERILPGHTLIPPQEQRIELQLRLNREVSRMIGANCLRVFSPRC
jgi:hypothetical protein